MLLPFLGGLNAYRGSRRRHDVISEYVYFAAVLLKTAGDHGHGREAVAALEESARRLDFGDVRPILSLSEELGGTDTMWREEMETLGGALFGHGMALAGPGFAVTVPPYPLELGIYFRLLAPTGVAAATVEDDGRVEGSSWSRR